MDRALSTIGSFVERTSALDPDFHA